MGWTYWRNATFQRDDHFFKQGLRKAEDLAKKALELNNFLAEPHMLLSYIYRGEHNWDQSLSEAEKAMSIAPFADYLYRYAAALINVGRPEDAIEMCKKAMKTDPFSPTYTMGILGKAYFMSEQYEKALDQGRRWFNHIEEVDPGYNISHAHALMAATSAMLGQMEKARKHAAEVRKIDPRNTSRRYEKMWNTKYEGIARWVSAFRTAGLE